MIYYSGARGAPWINKSSNLSIREILVVTSAYARTSARTDFGGAGRGKGVPRQPDGGGECNLFLVGNRAFGQPAFFLGGNCTTIVAFEKEVSLKSLSLFSKTIVQQ